MNAEIKTARHTHEAIKLKLHMRKLWTDHAIFTRMFIIDLIGDLPGMSYTIDRLDRSQEQTGNCFRPFFGDVAANKLTSLLKEHITIAVDLFKMIKIGNVADATILEDQWATNIENMSNLLCTANKYYSIDELTDIFRTYLILTKYQFIARIDGDYSAEIMYFDMGLNHIMRISDYLADGIVKEFFSEQSPDINQEADIYNSTNVLEENIQEENVLEENIQDENVLEENIQEENIFGNNVLNNNEIVDI